MKKQLEFEVVNIDLGSLTEVVYITVQLENGDEIEFTRVMREEYGNIAEYNTEIEDKEHQKIFNELDDDKQDEIMDYLQKVNTSDY